MSDSTGNPLPQPGWYPNPSGDPGYRWWDGRSWTEHVRAPEPQAPLHVHDQVPAAAQQPEPTAAPAAVPAPASVTEPETAVPTAAEAEDRPAYGERIPGYQTPAAPSGEAQDPAASQQGSQTSGQPPVYPSAQQPGSVQQPSGQPGYGYGQQPGYGAYPSYAPAPMIFPKAPEGAKVTTWFVWVIVLLPLVTLIVSVATFHTIEPSLVKYIQEIQSESQNPSNSATVPMLHLPASYNLTSLLGFVLYLVTVLLAWFDTKRLRAVGVVRPFHWAFAFLSTPVYVIGRSVVVRRRSGRGLLPLWIMIAVYVIEIVVTLSLYIGAVSGALQ